MSTKRSAAFFSVFPIVATWLRRGGIAVSETKTRTAGRPILPLAVLLLVAACVGMLPSGCGRKADPSPDGLAKTDGPSKIQICYLGLTCEPAIFAAYEQG